MTRRFVRDCCCGGAVALFFAASTHVQAQVVSPSDLLQMLDMTRDSGLTVAPAYEGWAPNPDGTARMFFGYLNRNYKEEIDIPIGPNNSFQPAPQDRGQPTHFQPRRRKGTFAIVVPRNFKGELVWTLSMRGKTEQVTGTLDPEQEISAEDIRGNARPKITRAGPDQTIALPQPATLTVEVTDDGLPKRSSPDAGIVVEWFKYRGPGKVTFSDDNPPVRGGKAMTTATFSEPGVYVLQVRTTDDDTRDGGGAEDCCRPMALATVTVKPAAAADGPR